MNLSTVNLLMESLPRLTGHPETETGPRVQPGKATTTWTRKATWKKVAFADSDSPLPVPKKRSRKH